MIAAINKVDYSKNQENELLRIEVFFSFT